MRAGEDDVNWRSCVNATENDVKLTQTFVDALVVDHLAIHCGRKTAVVPESARALDK